MKWAPTRNAPPASPDMLRANLATGEAELAALESERDEITGALAGLVPEPDRYVEAQVRLRDIEALLPSARRTVEAIRQAIPDAEDREKRDRIMATVDEQVRASARLQRALEPRYTKAAEAFAEVCREIQADKGKWRELRALADTVSPRVPVPMQGAEMTLRFDKFSSPNSGLKSVTDDLTIRAWNGATLFRC